MKRRANMTVVGAFVLLAVALLVAAIVVLGSGRWFRDTFTVLSFFDGSVQGLQIGAPVTFRGVSIGTVRDVRLGLPDDARFADPDNADTRIPVIYEIDRTLLHALGGTGEFNEQRLAELIEQGLRAQLSTESFVTGRLLVTLDFRPNTPAILADWDTGYPEIPALPQPIEEIQHQLAAVFDQLAEVELDTLIVATERMVDAFTHVAEDTRMQELSRSLDHTLSELDRTLASFRDAANTTSEHLGTLSTAAEQRASELEAVFTEAERTLVAMQAALDPESEISHQLGTTLYELGNAARALRVLLEAIEQNPSMLLRGRPVPEGNR